MAALESLNFDSDAAVHYIHCVLSNAPFDLNVSEVAPMIVPKPGTDAAKQLQAVGCRIVPHRLQMYKEPLEKKFGFVTFFIHQSSETTELEEEVHQRILLWIRQDLTEQLAAIKVSVDLGQPPECYSSFPFLRALQQQCSFLDATHAKDPRKLETFLLSKVTFYDKARNADKNNRSTLKREGKEAGKEDVWQTVGLLRISSLFPRELLWLGREHNQFPPIIITNKDISTATCNPGALHAFLKGALLPLFDVVP
ncbi:hypothetical protein DQ04_01211100 [Trypanosoma grayi]|uniref:hypothetical protein n=1 Tax=Trypanosoma grayi TaxID=71804 RepID=UPI0004F42F73|nr:hypothetical protein DQ04_01211100 [Trypanosoma grayi]KEG13111.1 hypothetical protein DQ04_01211100 [Trypanosoma grayi]